jgi:hypothetical protein
MNRRTFAKSAASTFAIMLLPSIGCGKVTVASAAALAQVLGSAVATLATIIGSTGLALQIQTATTKLVTLINTWVTGSTTTNIINAISDLEVLINAVSPLSPEISGLVALALGTIQAILSLFPTPGVTSVARGIPAVDLGTLGVQHPAKDERTFRGQWNTLLAPIAVKNTKWNAAKL